MRKILIIISILIILSFLSSSTQNIVNAQSTDTPDLIATIQSLQTDVSNLKTQVSYIQNWIDGTPTATITPSATTTPTFTDTVEPTLTSTETVTLTASPSNTVTLTSTVQPSPTVTNTPIPTNTATLVPTNTPTPDIQPSFPIRAVFYYPWFPEAWNQQGYNPFTNYNPTLGFYDSSNVAIVKSHIASMQYGNIQVGIASWWGVMKFTLHPTSYDWQFIPVAGQTATDSGSDNCH